MVQRDKNLRAYTSSDFVKYFARLYKEMYSRDYVTIYARDCAIMLKLMRKFHDADIDHKDIFVFMDKMFKEYPKRRRIKSIDMNWLYGIVDAYLTTDTFEDKAANKAKAPEIKLDEDMKEWLKKEKEKWLK